MDLLDVGGVEKYAACEAVVGGHVLGGDDEDKIVIATAFEADLNHHGAASPPILYLYLIAQIAIDAFVSINPQERRQLLFKKSIRPFIIKLCQF